jgi:hypothetical protein
MNMRIYIIIMEILLLANLLPAKTYKGAELRTLSTYLYGKFEVRMKSAAGSGLLSSFFTYYDGTGLPANWNEIDIEIMGRYTEQQQFNVISPGQVNHVYSHTAPFNPHLAFHVYSFEWTPDYVAWSVDGYEVYRQTGDHIAGITRAQKIMMNIWPPNSVSWAGSFNPDILPVYAYYDWIKYYSYTPGVDDNFTLQWTDNFTAWDQGRWAKATHTFDGNNCDFIPANAVFTNGYMILCLTDDVNTGYNGDPVADQDGDPPYVAWARSYRNYVDAAFSEEPDPLSAQAVSNYTIPGAEIKNAVLQSDQRRVRLQVDSLDKELTYNLIVNGIKDLAEPPNTMSLTLRQINSPPALPFRVNCGGPALSGFIADQEWTYALEYGRVGGYSIAHQAGTQFQGTTQPEIYEAELRDVTFYNIRLAEGIYNVTLLLAETEYNAVNQRVFDVYCEGQLCFNNLDIYNEAGSYSALAKVIENLSVDDGLLEVYLEASQGETVLSGIKIDLVATGIESPAAAPEDFSWKVYPNPFNAAATVEYQLSAAAVVQLKVYNMLGQLVSFIERGYESSGNHSINIDGRQLSSGIYFVEMFIDRKSSGRIKVTNLK